MLENKPDFKQQKQVQNEYVMQERLKEKNEADKDEIKKLRVQVRQLQQESQELQRAKQQMIQKRMQTQKKFEELCKSSKIVVLGDGKFLPFGLVPDAVSSDLQSTKVPGSEGEESEVQSKASFLEDEQKMITGQTPVEAIVYKISSKEGLTLNKVFQLLDGDGDGVLTLAEIRQNIGDICADLKPEELE